MTLTDDEINLRKNKIVIIGLLSDKLVSYKINSYKDFKVPDDKPLAYYDATIEILNNHIKKAELTEPKKMTFDKLEKERANMTEAEIKELIAAQKRNNSVVDSALATKESRCTFKGNIQAPGNILLRYRGNETGDEFSKKYPFGVLL